MFVTAYAIANFREVEMGPAIVDYLRRIDATLEPYEGRFLVHGAAPEMLEGKWTGQPIIIEFPSLDLARAWYDSPTYRLILPLRTEHSEGEAILIDGVDPGHRATDILTWQ